MKTITSYLTKNPCYTAGRTIKVKGLMLHSVGCPQSDPTVFVKNWNRSSYNRACVHGFIGDEETYITLPCFETPAISWRGWHAGGSANNTHLGFEMCEPSNIKYTGGASFTCSNPSAAIAFVKKTTANAVELFAKLCKFHNLNPLADGVIISHREGCARGVASNHGDPDHLWRGLGMDYNMDKFRKDVYNAMNNVKEEEDMDVARFKQLWYEMREEFQDNDAGDWSKEARDWAVKSGIYQGTSSDEFNGAWEDLMTREQMAVLLYRFAQMIGKA